MNDMITDPLAAAEAKALREAEKKVQAPLDETGGLAPRMAPDVSPGEVIAGGFEAIARGYAKGPRALLWTSSEGGLRGAAVIETLGKNMRAEDGHA